MQHITPARTQTKDACAALLGHNASMAGVLLPLDKQSIVRHGVLAAFVRSTLNLTLTL